MRRRPVSDREPRRAVTADEVDVHSRWRKVIAACYRPGYTAAVKRRTNRRERRERREDIRRRLREEA